MTIRFTDKTLRNGAICNRLAEGESNADTINIVGPTSYGDIDLTALTWSMVGNYTNYEESAEQALPMTVSGSEMTLIWSPDETFTAHPGGMDLVLVAVDGTGSVVLKILGEHPMQIRRANRRITASVASSLEKMANTVLQAAVSCLNYRNDAQTASETAIQNASIAVTKAEEANASAEEAKAALLKLRGTCYGFHVDGAESDPAGKITYLRDAVGMTPAFMNYTSGKFDYGSWKDAFFMPRPCMLRFDGTVDYYLDPEDYTKREDGTDSDVANVDYAGNAMMEWGRDGKQIWWKCEADAGDAASGSVYIADDQVDETFHNWNFINCKGNSVPHFYTPCFNGALDSEGRLRSISGLAPVNGKTAQDEIDAAKLNNTTDNVIWYTENYADVQLINFLLLLMGRNTDTKTVFGNGHYTGGSSASSLLNTGTMNARGLFWGTNGTGSGVKVFGMENWWGNQWRRYAGHINDSGTQKVKLTYGTEDGSTAAAYNTTGDGYLSVGATPSGTSGGYITNMNFSKDGMLPQTATGSSTAYYCDGLWFNNGQTDYAFRGGYCNSGLLVGALCCRLNAAPSAAVWNFGAALSCKPLV